MQVLFRRSNRSAPVRDHVNAETIQLQLTNEIGPSNPVDGRELSFERTRPRARLKTWIFRFVSVVIGLTIALFASELALRLAGWPSPGLYIGGAGPVALRPAGQNGGAFPPNTRGEMRHYDYSVEWNTNSLGFRDPEVTVKRDGEWRIGFLGDSFTAGVGVRQQDRFSDVFGAAIIKSRPSVTVWNLGAPLCGTACEAEMLTHVNHVYQLDEIVLAFCGGNDLEDNTAWYTKDHANLGTKQGLTPSAKNWLRQHSRLATFLWINYVRGWATLRPPITYSQTDLDRYWPDTERSLRVLRKAAGSRRLTILYLPSQSEWDDAAWQIMRSRYHAADSARYLVRDAVEAWTRREAVQFVDTTSWLRQCNPASDCIYPVDPHWNAKGHSVIGRGLIDHNVR
jgi:GDSL-like lipase/acylhydrolase family protein